MTWTYNDSVTPGVLTSTGATEASPDSLLAGIAIVQAANAARGYRNGLVAWFQDVEARAGNSFIIFDNESSIEARGASFVNPQNGGVIHGFRSTYTINTNVARFDQAADFEAGASFICRLNRPNDPSPRIIYLNTQRHDYPTITGSSVLDKVDIQGLDLCGVGGGVPVIFKLFYGNAIQLIASKKIRFFGGAFPQMFANTYEDFYFETLTLDSQGTASTVNLVRPTYFNTNRLNIGGAIRAATVVQQNPTFLNDCWTGNVAFNADVNAASRLFLQYSYINSFKSGLAPVDGVNVRFTRARQSVNGAPTWTAPDAVLTATSDAQGVYTPVNLLDAYREGTSQTNLERFNWSAKARSYDRRTAGENIFTNRVMYQHSVNMSAGYSEEVQMLDVPHLTLTQAQAAALTGIALVADGATGGTVTISGDVSASDLWHYYRDWISQTANFDSADSWTYDGQTLNIGAWNVVVNAGATLTASFVTTGAVSGDGEIVGSYTDANGTRVTIRTPDDLPLSTYLTIDGVDQAWQVGQTARNIFVQPNSAVRIYAHAYGYQPRIVNITGNTASDYVITLALETNVNTAQDTTIRDTIAGAFDVGADAFSRLFLSVNADLRQYSPQEVLNALHYFTVTQGALIAAAATAANSVDGFALQRGGFIIRSPGFYGKVADSITASGPLGILVPLAIAVDPSVYVAVPSYTPVEVNTSGIVLQYAPWTQQEADVNLPAVAGAVWTAPTRTLTSAGAGGASAQEVWEYVDRTLTSGGGSGGVTLAEIEASTVLAKEATSLIIRAKTDGITFTGANINAIAQVVTDKTGYALTTAERQAIAVAVETAILNDGDGQAIIDAIVQAIGNSNVDELALVAAIRSDIERDGGALSRTLSKAGLAAALSA